MRTLTLWIMGLALVGLLAAPMVAEETKAKAAGHRPQLTEEQRAAVKALVEKLHQDMKPLREAVKTEMQKLRELRKEKAGAEAIQAQVAVVKEKVAAVKARFEQFKTDLKAAVPAEVYQKIMERIRQRRADFLEDHPRLKEFLENHRGDAN